MNKIYRTVYNETTNTWVAVEETAKSHRKSSGGVVDCTQPESMRHSGSLKLRGLTAAVAIALLSPLAVSPAFAAAPNGTTHSNTQIGSSDGDANRNTVEATGVDTVWGIKNTVSNGSTAFGQSNTATGDRSTAFGNSNTALGNQSTAFGVDNVATGDNSTAFGNSNLAGYVGTDVDSLQQMGITTVADFCQKTTNGAYGCNQQTTLEGARQWAINNQFGSEAGLAKALGAGGVKGAKNATAWGLNNIAGNKQATAFGSNNKAYGENSSILGGENNAIGKFDDAGNLTDQDGGGKNAAILGGSGNKVSGENAVAWGEGSQALAKNSTAFGAGSKVESENSLAALGGVVDSKSNNSIAIGLGAMATNGKKNTNVTAGDGAIAIGNNSKANGPRTISIGGDTDYAGAYAHNKGSIAIGGQAEAIGATVQLDGNGNIIKNAANKDLTHKTGYYDRTPTSTDINVGTASQITVIGDRAAGYGDQSIAIGADTVAAGQASIAIGGDDVGKQQDKALFQNTQTKLSALKTDVESAGYDVSGTLTRTTSSDQAFKDQTFASGDASIAFGQKAVSQGDLSNAFGLGARSVGDKSESFGTMSYAGAENSTAVGTVAMTGNAAKDSTAIGYMAQTGGEVDLAATIKEVEYNNDGTLKGITDTGELAYQQTYSVNGGAEQKVKDLGKQTGSGINAVAVGERNKVLGNNSTAVGQGNIIVGNNSGAFGDPTIITGNYSYSLGHDNVIATDKTFVLGGKVTKTATNSVFLGEDTAYVLNGTTKGSGKYEENYTIGDVEYKNDFKAQNAVGVVSVGDTNKERRIQNVAAGWVNKDSTDVINGSQLNAAYEDLQWRASVTANGGIVKNEIGKEKPQVIGDYEKSPNKGIVNFKAGDGIEIETANANSLDMTFKVNKADPHTVDGGAIKAPTPDADTGSQYWDATQTANAINASYWIASDGDATKNVSPSNKVNWVGQNGATVTLSGDTFTVGLDKDYLPTVSEGKNTKVTEEIDGNHINYVVDAVDTIVKAGTGVTVTGGGIDSETNQRTYTVSNAWTVTQDADGNTTINDGTNDYTITKAAKTTLTANNGEEPNETKGNITLTQDGDNYDVALNNNVKLGDDKEAGSLNVSDKKDGDNPVANTEIKPNEINFTDAGDNNTGVITGLAPNFTETDATTTTAPVAPTNINNAATVGDVLNAGWNLQGNDTPVDFVTHGDTVNFVDGQYTTVSVENKDGVNNVKVDVNLTGGKNIEITKDGVINYTGADNDTIITLTANNGEKPNKTKGNIKLTQKGDNYDVALNNTITVGNEKDDDKPITIDGTTGDITLGGDTGGNINNVANHINPDGTMIDEKAPTNQAATVQDVLNSGWNVKVGDADPEYIKHGDQVAFIDGKGTKVSGSKDGIAYDINVDENSPLSINKDGALTVNVGGFDNTTDGSVKANNPNGLATAGDIANAVNNSGWNVTTSASTGEVSGTTKELIKPTNTVTFDAGDNIRIVQSGNKISVGTTKNMNVKGNLNVAGDTTVGNLAVNPNSNVDMGGNQIHNVADGVEPTDAVNMRQLKQAVGGDLTNVHNRIDGAYDHANASAASAIAVASMPQAYLPGKSLIAIGGGSYRGQTGYAIGISSISDGGNWIIKGTATGNSKGNYGVGLGAGYQW